MNPSLKRVSISRFRPYRAIINNKQMFLFSANEKLRLRRVLSIEKYFNDDELAFFSTDPLFYQHTYAYDAINVYEVGNRKQRPLFFLDENGVYWKTKIVPHTYKDGRECLKIVLTDEQQIVQRF